MKSQAKEYLNKTKKFFLDKRVQWAIFIILALGILILSSWIRLQTLPNLIDSTTEDYTPLDLDSYYFLRHSQVLLENNWKYPEIDLMRYPTLNPAFSPETMPYAVAILYKIINSLDGSRTLMYANVMSPLIFFLMGLIAFFFLFYLVTKNKWLALFASFLVSILPPYLYRNLVGSSDHDSFGMFGFFLALLIFYWLFSRVQEKKINLTKSILYGLIAGFFTMFSITSWGGSGKYLFMILPLLFFLNWFLNKKENHLQNFLFYLFFILGTLVSSFIFNYSPKGILEGYMLGISGILTFFALFYAGFELILKKYSNLDERIKKNPRLISFGLTIVAGILFYQIFVGHVFEMVFNLLRTIITPFGTGRVGLTVAENRQPYLTDLIAQLGKTLFWSFFLGCFAIGYQISKGISKKNLHYLFSLSFILFISGMLFSRFSSSSIFNGENFISKAFFFLGFFLFLVCSIYIYNKSEWKVDLKWIFLGIIAIVMILSVRSAIRVFFVIVPFVTLISVLLLFELYSYLRKSKDDLLKIFLVALILFLLINLIFASMNFGKASFAQAKYSTPPYNSDWQKSMAWVRENTSEDAIFLHWWDYGYWVQTGGKRATLTDGGHFNGYWDHLIARYVLTTPRPEIAKSYMKTHNVSYLLIDPTDIGKYSAYSSIADDNDSSDRASALVSFVSDPKTTQETANSTIRYYQGGIYVDEDFFYEFDGKKVYFPKNKAIVAGFIVSKGSEGYNQPVGVYYLNGEQYQVPLRYLSTMGDYIDFGRGFEAGAYIYPNVYGASSGPNLDMDGALIYLSPKIKDSLVVKLYLLGDPLEEYPELELVNSQSTYPFNFNYGGFNGPINIYKFTPTEEILINQEFLATDGIFGELDNLEFIKK